MLPLTYTSAAMTLAAPGPPVPLMLQGTGLFTADARMHTMAVGLQGTAVCRQLPAPAPQHAAPAGLPLPHPDQELRDASPQPQQGAHSEACPGSQELKQEGDAAAAPAAPAAGQQAASGNRSDNNSSDSIQTTRAHALLASLAHDNASLVSFPCSQGALQCSASQLSTTWRACRQACAPGRRGRGAAVGAWPQLARGRDAAHGVSQVWTATLTLLGYPTPLASRSKVASCFIGKSSQLQHGSLCCNGACSPPQVAAVVPVCSGVAA